MKGNLYTIEELKLNKRLYDECSKPQIDFALVEEILRYGADPLGAWDSQHQEEHIYGEIVCESQDSGCVNLPKLTCLFLQYGMNVDCPRIGYDCDDSINPMWMFSFVANENAIKALKMLLDNGLSEESFGVFWDHSMIDLQLACGDPQNDDFWNDLCIWTFRMLMLGASYDHILRNDEYLREFICLDHNTYDVHNFRRWDKFEYFFDTTHCETEPELYDSVVYVYEKETSSLVWKMGIGKKGRASLSE